MKNLHPRLAKDLGQKHSKLYCPFCKILLNTDKWRNNFDCNIRSNLDPSHIIDICTDKYTDVLDSFYLRFKKENNIYSIINDYTLNNSSIRTMDYGDKTKNNYLKLDYLFNFESFNTEQLEQKIKSILLFS